MSFIFRVLSNAKPWSRRVEGRRWRAGSATGSSSGAPPSSSTHLRLFPKARTGPTSGQTRPNSTPSKDGWSWWRVREPPTAAPTSTTCCRSSLPIRFTETCIGFGRCRRNRRKSGCSVCTTQCGDFTSSSRPRTSFPSSEAVILMKAHTFV